MTTDTPSVHSAAASWLLLGCCLALGSACSNDDSSSSSAEGDAGSADADADATEDDAPEDDSTSDDSDEVPSYDCTPAEDACDGFGDERPTRLSEHSAVYDPARLEMIVFGGTPSIPMNCSFGGATEFKSETWIYSDPCNQWLKVDGDGPPAAGRHASVWADGSMWLFGGRYRAEEDAEGPYTMFDELYRFDVAKREWSRVSVEGEVPSARANAAMAYDGRRGRLWLFGGNTSADGSNTVLDDELWYFDLETLSWSPTLGGGGSPPPARYAHNLLYDSRRDALVVFGGSQGITADGGFGSNGLWAAKVADGQWRQLGSDGGSQPDTRFWSGLVYDSEDDSYLLFGGHDDTALGNRNDTWRFHPESNAWEQLATGDSFNKEARDFCDFPPDFATIDFDMPERRNAHAFVWSEGCGHALLFGGKTDCGSTDDVWRLKNDAWQERQQATEGEVCLRWRDEPDRCGDVCF